MLGIVAQVGWPVLDRIRLGDRFAIPPHGVFIAIGFLVGAWLFGRIGPRWGVSHDDAQGVVFWSLIGAIVGARFFYVLAHLSEFDSIVDMLKIWEGGISLLGGIAGAVLINVPRVRRQGYRFFQVTDPVAPSLALGIAVGRIGDLIIADHLGKPTSWLLAWTYDGGTIAPPFVESARGTFVADLQGGVTETITRGEATLREGSRVLAEGVGVHQTALYDMLSAAALFLVLCFVLMRKPRREGILTLTFGLWYGVSRIVEDSLRIDKRFFGLTGSQWTALTVAAICAVILIGFAVRQDPDAPSGGGPPPPDDDAARRRAASATAEAEPERA